WSSRGSVRAGAREGREAGRPRGQPAVADQQDCVVQPEVVRTHRVPTESDRQVNAGATNSHIPRQFFFAARAGEAARSERADRYGEPVRDGGANVTASAVTTAASVRKRTAIERGRLMGGSSCLGGVT